MKAVHSTFEKPQEMVTEKPRARISLVDSFCGRYKIVPANTHQLRDECFALRYRVYCEEYSFESRDDYPDRREQDSFDEYSDHFLIQEKYTGEYTGTVRLIKSADGGEQTILPVEKYCLHAFNSSISPEYYESGSYAEISRLAVKRPTPTKAFGAVTSLVRAEFGYSLCTLALSYCCLAQFCLSDELDHCFTMMEPRLAGLLSRLGIKFESVGDLIDYHGSRAPFYWKKGETHLSLSAEKWDFLEFVKDSIKPDGSEVFV